MALVNEHFLKLPGSYLFSDIAKKINTFRITHPKQDIIRLGIGDVTQPLPKACIEAMHKAVEELADKDTFRGYSFLRFRDIHQRRSKKRYWKYRRYSPS